MYYLILKDMLILKRMIFLIIVFIAFFHVLQNPPILAISLAGFLFVSSAASFDDRSNAHIMLNSLPINRKQIISSKYVGAFLFGLFAILLAVVFQTAFYLIFKGSYDQPIPEANHLLIGMLCILLFTSFYYPILYKFGEKYTRIITMILLVGFIIFGQIIAYLFKGNIQSVMLFVNQFSAAQLLIAGVAVTAILFFLSWLITTKIYEAKDF